MGTELCKKEVPTSNGDQLEVVEGALPELQRCTSAATCFLPEFKGDIHYFYDLERQVGAGGFGEVWLATERVLPDTNQECHGRHVAVKQVRKNTIPMLASAGKADDLTENLGGDDPVENLRTEIEVLRSLDHPAICRLLQVVEDSKSIYLVMEHCSGGELFDRIMEEGAMNEHKSSQTMRQVTGALMYCHAHHVLHRDVKPENIMFVWPHKKDVKLIDFGISCLTSTPMKAQIGSLPFSAPEALQGKNCNEKIDMWGVGCVAYIMLSGGMPFGGPQMRQLIISGTYSLEGEFWEDVSDDAKDFIKRLLEVDEAQRMSASEAFDHRWLNNAGRKSHPERASVALGNLQKFQSSNLFTRVCRTALAKQLDEDNIHKIHTAFCEMDKNHDGTLSLSEFKSAWRKFRTELDDKDIEDIFNSTDENHDHEIDYTEFIAAALDQQIAQQEDACWSVFRAFDNGKGRISKEDLDKVLQREEIQQMFGQGLTERVWKELSETPKALNSPLKRDGSVDFDEFVQALCGPDQLPAWSKGLQTLHDRTECDKMKETIAVGALPILGRQAAVHSSQPAGARAMNVSMPGLMLPIGSRRDEEEEESNVPASGGMMLPIASRQDEEEEESKNPAPGGMMLPIAHR